MPSPARLRDRLWRLCEDTLYELARDGIEPGRLALVAGSNAALKTLGEAPDQWEPASRVARGRAYSLMLDGDAGIAAAVDLDPDRAIALIEAALSRLNGD